MISNINTLYFPKVVNKIAVSNINNFSFLGIRRVKKTETDVFQREQPQNTITIDNPFTNTPCSLNYEYIDLNKKQTLRFRSESRTDLLKMQYDPEKNETLHDKNTNKDIDVVVLKSSNKLNPNEICFHFFSKDLKTNYGYGMLSDYVDDNEGEIKEIFVKPNYKNINGLNELTDKYAIQHCKEEYNKKPTIVSYPKPENYKDYYSAGKRFVIPEKGSVQYQFFMDKYNNPDPNNVIDKEKNTLHWPALKMYLPEEKVDEHYNNYLTTGLHFNHPLLDIDVDIDENIDITKPHKYIIERGDSSDECTVEFDPKKKGQLIDKVNGKPIDVFIVKFHDDYFRFTDSFYFFSKNLKHEYGHVELGTTYLGDALGENFNREKINGDRIIVNWLKNEDDKYVGGVGKLADKVAAKYCMDNNIKPNIISQAGFNSHIAHYSRGKRFIQPKLGTAASEFLFKTYGTRNPNIALKKMIDDSKQTGKKIDLKDWNEYFFVMYLPKYLIKKYQKEDY